MSGEGDDERHENRGREGRVPRKPKEFLVPAAAIGALISSLAGTVGGAVKSETLQGKSDKIEAKLDMIVNRITSIEITVAKMGALEAQSIDLRERIKDLEARLRQVEQRK